jgi:hypothetical protein
MSKNPSKAKNVRLGQNNLDLEDRNLMSVSAVYLSARELRIYSTSTATDVRVDYSGSNIKVTDNAPNGFYLVPPSWTFNAAAVSSIRFDGSNSNDRFVNNLSTIRAVAYGYGGNDYLEGYNGNDAFYGGENDDTLVGYGGNDYLDGGNGKDTLRGMEGNDTLVGGWGADFLDGGNGTDNFQGGGDFDRYKDVFDPNNRVIGGASHWDVDQESSGTCGILATMAAMTRSGWQPNIRFLGGTTYEVTMHQRVSLGFIQMYLPTNIRVNFDGNWSDGDAQPTNYRNSSDSPNGTPTGEFWALIYQRAYLQLNGVDWNNQSAVQGGAWANSHDPYRALTGRNPSGYALGSSVTPESINNMVGKNPMWVRDVNANGEGHFYAVVGMNRINGVWRIQLYNPWASDGTNSGTSFYADGRNNGFIEIDFNTFRSRFTNYYVG